MRDWLVLSAVLLLIPGDQLRSGEPTADRAHGAPASPAEDAFRQSVRAIVALGVVPWGDAELQTLQRVDKNPGDPLLLGRVIKCGRQVGYMLLSESPPHTLLEWGVDADEPLSPGEQAKGLTGIRNVQQFKGIFDGKEAVSGCVPSAAANVAAYWAARFPAIEPDIATDEGLRRLVLNLRERFDVALIPDEPGYTDDGTTLTGAYSANAAAGLRRFFREREVGLEVTGPLPLDHGRLKDEIAAGRPVFVAGAGIRLPHKPWLTWGHALTAVGWAEIGDRRFVMLHDNFYPTQSANAARWLPIEQLREMILVSPSDNSE